MEDLDLWKKAGKIAGLARDFGKNLVVEGANYFDVSNKIEEFINKKSAKIGFPVQLSTNSMAAHYTAFPDDQSVFIRGDLVKLDLGAQIDGYIGDTALTLEIGTKNHNDLIKASDHALQSAIKLAKPGVKICEIGEAVEAVITSFGFKPIKNLSGHKVDRYVLHSSLSIPNYNNKDKTELEEDIVIAIEPFASTGAGAVKEGKQSSNYRFFNSKPIRNQSSRDVLKFIQEEFNTLPFAKRHLMKKFNNTTATLALYNLEKEGIIYQYPQLPEKDSNSFVSQHEHTILVKDKPIILTKAED